MVFLAVALEQIQPGVAALLAARNCSRLIPPGEPDSPPGMWSAVLESKRTTSYSVRWNSGANFVLIFDVAVGGHGVVGFELLIWPSPSTPFSSQPNLFWLPVGLQAGLPVQDDLRHFAEWKPCAR